MFLCISETVLLCFIPSDWSLQTFCTCYYVMYHHLLWALRPLRHLLLLCSFCYKTCAQRWKRKWSMLKVYTEEFLIFQLKKWEETPNRRPHTSKLISKHFHFEIPQLSLSMNQSSVAGNLFTSGWVISSLPFLANGANMGRKKFGLTAIHLRRFWPTSLYTLCE